MQSVQSPIIPVIGELIRANPGTISLGQGVVHYGPPPEAIEHIQKFLSRPENHKYQLVPGIAELQEAIRAKLAADNGIAVGEDACRNGQQDVRERRGEPDDSDPDRGEIEAVSAHHEPSHADESELKTEDARDRSYPETPVVGVGERPPATGRSCAFQLRRHLKCRGYAG